MQLYCRRRSGSHLPLPLSPTCAPGLAHICLGFSPHLRCDCLRRATAASALRLRDGRRGAYRGHVFHGRGVPAADVGVESRRIVKRLRADHEAVHTAPHQKADRPCRATPSPRKRRRRRRDAAGCSIQSCNKMCFVAQRCCITRTAFPSRYFVRWRRRSRLVHAYVLACPCIDICV